MGPGNMNLYLQFPQHWYGVDGWNPSLWTTIKHLSSIFNSNVADGLTIQAAVMYNVCLIDAHKY